MLVYEKCVWKLKSSCAIARLCQQLCGNLILHKCIWLKIWCTSAWSSLAVTGCWWHLMSTAELNLVQLTHHSTHDSVPIKFYVMDSECWMFARCELHSSLRVSLQNMDVLFLYLGFLGCLAVCWIHWWVQGEQRSEKTLSYWLMIHFCVPLCGVVRKFGWNLM